MFNVRIKRYSLASRRSRNFVHTVKLSKQKKVEVSVLMYVFSQQVALVIVVAAAAWTVSDVDKACLLACSGLCNQWETDKWMLGVLMGALCIQLAVSFP